MTELWKKLKPLLRNDLYRNIIMTVLIVVIAMGFAISVSHKHDWVEKSTSDMRATGANGATRDYHKIIQECSICHELRKFEM